MRLASAVVLRSQTDERLTALARDGHEQAFVALAHRYRRELLAHARRVGATDQAEDVVQQALLSAWSALRRGAEVRDVRAWLHRIVHNGAVRLGRQAGGHLELDDGLAAPLRTDTTAELRLEARHALAAVARLPERQRRALELTAIGAVSGREAAAELGVSEGVLRVLVHRARATLRSGAAALVPAPLVNWAAGVATDDVTSRVAQLCAGAGVTATVAKVGATVAFTVSVVGAAHVLHVTGVHPRAGRPAATGRSAAVGDPRPAARRPPAVAAAATSEAAVARAVAAIVQRPATPRSAVGASVRRPGAAPLGSGTDRALPPEPSDGEGRANSAPGASRPASARIEPAAGSERGAEQGGERRGEPAPTNVTPSVATAPSESPTPSPTATAADAVPVGGDEPSPSPSPGSGGGEPSAGSGDSPSRAARASAEP